MVRCKRFLSGDTVYAGGTRQMLEYFDAIEFPCPQLENPLMYYCKFLHLINKNRTKYLQINALDKDGDKVTGVSCSQTS